jgi:hypothetical protein
VIANALTRRGCRLSDIETLPAIQPCLPRRTQAAPRGERGGDDQKGRRRGAHQGQRRYSYFEYLGINTHFSWARTRANVLQRLN